jgi:hypothetical protein
MEAYQNHSRLVYFAAKLASLLALSGCAGLSHRAATSSPGRHWCPERLWLVITATWPDWEAVIEFMNNMCLAQVNNA